jgi:hypothetical protein
MVLKENVMKTETQAAVSRLVKALVKKGGNGYAVGFLETYIADMIDHVVTDPIQLEMLRIKMLGDGIDALLDMR